MKFLVLCALVGLAACEGNSKTQGKFVWDLLKPALTSAEVLTLLSSKDAGYPTYSSVPQTAFSCSSKAQPGFYADVDTQCQVFHRCDQSLNQTDFMCVNSTVFNQITLVCDSWFNVECEK
jgi:Chitin binding Peritrophin-A domain